MNTDQVEAGMPLGDSWDDLPPEVFGVVGRNLSAFDKEMMHYLLCIGPTNACVVRTKYLTGNEAYLARSLKVTNLEKMKLKVRGWMQCNDWKTRCRGAKSKKNVRTLSLTPELASTIHLESRANINTFEIKHNRDTQGALNDCEDPICMEQMHAILKLGAMGVWSVIHSIGGELIQEKKSAEEMQKIIRVRHLTKMEGS